MAKHKFEKRNVIEICGYLDLDENDNLIVNVKGETYDFVNDVVKFAIGQEVHFKTEIIED